LEGRVVVAQAVKEDEDCGCGFGRGGEVQGGCESLLNEGVEILLGWDARWWQCGVIFLWLWKMMLNEVRSDFDR
jgi:hypothetical protein